MTYVRVGLTNLVTVRTAWVRFGIVTMLVTIGSVGIYLYETTLDDEDDSEYRTTLHTNETQRV